MEIKCQLDTTDDFYCRSYCLLNVFRAPLCPSSGAREYFTSSCCLSYLVLWFSSYRYVVELRVAAAAARKWDPQPSAPHHTDNLKTKAPNTTGSNYLCNTLELLMMGIMVPETCWASNKICNKNHLSHLVGILFPHISYKFRHRECMGLQEYLEGNAFGQQVPNALYAEDCFDDSPVLLVCLASSIYVSTVSVLPLT